MNDPQCFVYGLTDPRTGEIRYIGKTSQGMRRPLAHAWESKLAKERGRHKANWIAQLQREHLEYGVTVLDILPDTYGLDALEQRWIAYGRGVGWPLTNLTNGGEGMHGFSPSAETRAKIAAGNRGKVRTAETRARLAETSRGRRHTPEECARMRAVVRRSPGPRSAEAIAKSRAKLLGRVVPADQREKMRIAALGRKASPATREKMSQSHKRRWECLRNDSRPQ